MEKRKIYPNFASNEEVTLYFHISFAAIFLPIGWAGTKVSSLTFTDEASAASGHGKEVKKAILAARDQIKSGKDLDKAEKSMMSLLNDSDNLDNDKIWSTLFDALQGQYKAGNEALYLKQKYDTAAFSKSPPAFSPKWSVMTL